MTPMNVPSDGRHLELINGWNEWTVVGQQKPDDLESVEVFMAHDRAFAVVIGKLQLCFHQQTIQHPTTTKYKENFKALLDLVFVEII